MSTDKGDPFDRPTRGGLSLAVWQSKAMQTYIHDQVPAFGWVGHSLRTDRRDKLVEKALRAHRRGMSSEWVATVLTWKWGRHLGDELSFSDGTEADDKRHIQTMIDQTKRTGFY